MWQLRELKNLAALAYAHVPFYKKIWQENDIHPLQIRTISDIQNFPITTKKIFRQVSFADLINDEASVNEYTWYHTSGSAGEPFRFPTARDDRFQYPNIFYKYRFLLWLGVTPRYLAESLKVVHITENPVSSVPGPTLPWQFVRTDPERALQRLAEYSPEIIEARPAVLFDVASTVRKLRRLKRPYFRFIYSYGEMLTPELRGFIEDTFGGGELYDLYGLAEVGGVGVECREHNGFHLNEESFVVEIVDDNGYALQPGNFGRVIVTRFSRHYIMPFIRYDTGDTGMIMPDPCPCGLFARRLVVQGRGGGIFSIKGKKYYHGELRFALGKLSSLMYRYQLVKISDEKAELRIVPTAEYTQNSARHLQRIFEEGFGFEPEIKVLDTIPVAKNEKMQIIVDQSRDTLGIHGSSYFEGG